MSTAQPNTSTHYQRSASPRPHHRASIRYFRENLRKLEGLKLTEQKAKLVTRRAAYLRGSQEIADSLLAGQCGMARSSVSLAKQSLRKRGLASWGMEPWQDSRVITSYDELPALLHGTQIPFEFTDELLPKIRTKATLRIALIMLQEMSDGKHGDVFTTTELLALTGMDKRKLHPALKSDVFERVGHGRYRLALRDWKPIARPSRSKAKVTGIGHKRSCSLVSSFLSVGREDSPSENLPPSRARDRASATRPGGNQDLRGMNFPKCSQAPQVAVTRDPGGCDPVQPGENPSTPQGSCTQAAGQPAEDDQGSTHPAGSDQMRPRFALQRGWTKAGKTSLDLAATWTALTGQPVDYATRRYLRFWVLRAGKGGYDRVSALLVWAGEHWSAVQDALDVDDPEPTIEVIYNCRAAIGRLMRMTPADERRARAAQRKCKRDDRRRQREAERKQQRRQRENKHSFERWQRQCKAQADREQKALPELIAQTERELEQARQTLKTARRGSAAQHDALYRVQSLRSKLISLEARSTRRGPHRSPKG